MRFKVHGLNVVDNLVKFSSWYEQRPRDRPKPITRLPLIFSLTHGASNSSLKPSYIYTHNNTPPGLWNQFGLSIIQGVCECVCVCVRYACMHACICVCAHVCVCLWFGSIPVDSYNLSSH